MKVISLFNHKGGVSKTTTSFNLGWALAEKGYKTLLVDADPQCNLTSLVLNYNEVGDISEYYKNNNGCDIASGLDPVMSGSVFGIIAGKPIQTANQNLYLYCGSLKLSEFETQISVALTTSQAIPAIKNIPGSISELIRKTAEKNEIEYVIIDMSPSVGALNQCLLMSSDYFIVPTSPDFFCAEAIKSLSNVLPRWNKEIKRFRHSDLTYKFPEEPPKFLGFISQRYRPRGGAPARSFQQWIDVIKKTVIKELIPKLTEIKMSIEIKDFDQCISGGEPFNLANVADFNSLIAQSQKHNMPIFALNDSQIEQSGVVLDKMKISRDKFKEVFSTLAEEVHELTDITRSH